VSVSHLKNESVESKNMVCRPLIVSRCVPGKDEVQAQRERESVTKSSAGFASGSLAPLHVGQLLSERSCSYSFRFAAFNCHCKGKGNSAQMDTKQEILRQVSFKRMEGKHWDVNFNKF
jgi:hypothetical protein